MSSGKGLAYTLLGLPKDLATARLRLAIYLARGYDEKNPIVQETRWYIWMVENGHDPVEALYKRFSHD